MARALAYGGYQNLQGLLTGQPSSYGGNTYNVMEFLTGKANTDLGQTGFVNFQNLSYNSTSFYFDTWWQQLYLGVGATNLALEKIPGITAAGFTEAQKRTCWQRCVRYAHCTIFTWYVCMALYLRSPR
ncbi:hypothetical protein [Mucilaginibacter antarcticus]|uniref:hypothetical protein n=1 Tax=Mucilaginibacter antarcticus TaxID=1855725 RepID=UPI0036418AEA